MLRAKLLRRFLLTTLSCLSFQLCADGKLKNAIKEGNVDVVTKALQTTRFSKNELLELIDISQEIINQCKSAWEIFAINTKTNPEATQKKVDHLKIICRRFKYATIISLFTTISGTIYNYFFSNNNFKSVAFAYLGNLATTSISIFWLMNEFNQQAVKKVVKLKKKYNNALSIKHLLIKNYYSIQSQFMIGFDLNDQ